MRVPVHAYAVASVTLVSLTRRYLQSRRDVTALAALQSHARKQAPRQFGRRHLAGLAAATAQLQPRSSWAEAGEVTALPDDLQKKPATVSIPLLFDDAADGARGILTLPEQVSDKTLPLVLFSGGFGTYSDQYSRITDELSRGGCAVVRYDIPNAMGADDVTLADATRKIMDSLCLMPGLQTKANTDRMLLTGHSRGAKLSCLAAASDERVSGLCLLDPVDNTVWVKGRSGFPSACESLHTRGVPVAIVGAGSESPCAPSDANFEHFYRAARNPAWLLLVTNAKHAQFLDPTGMGAFQRALCGQGEASDTIVFEAATSACLAWSKLACGQYRSYEAVSPTLIPTKTHPTGFLLPGYGMPSHSIYSSDKGQKTAIQAAADEAMQSLQTAGGVVESFLKL